MSKTNLPTLSNKQSLDVITEFKSSGSNHTCYLKIVSPPEMVNIDIANQSSKELAEKMTDIVVSRSHQNYVYLAQPGATRVQLIFGTRGALCFTLGIKDYDKVIDMKLLSSKNIVKTFESEGQVYLVVILKTYLRQLIDFASVVFEETLGKAPTKMFLCIVSTDEKSKFIFHNTIPTIEKTDIYGKPERYVDITDCL